ncbi:daptide biosynthesis RiPP recognition protein [Microbacterium sp. NPDC028030]|uniref:daptide biosynthesis RiPP recognition protein n=1 Tax=Microbacterium sp. NPDC028030 TaxID=3155124 RepID=UPI0033F83543
MRQGERAVEADERGARALREWITGERREYARVFLVEPGAATEDVWGVAGPDDAVLLPMECGAYDGQGMTVRYSGALSDVGDELFLGERVVELQDYVAAAFVQIVGPTAVSMVDGTGWQAFLADADLARRTGVFPSALLDPRVLLADRSALMKPTELVTPSAIRVHRDGSVALGIGGEVIGMVDQLPTLLATPVPRSAALAGAVPAHVLDADLATRGWIGRYLLATDLMKMLRLANGAATISGFGGAFFDDHLADAEPLTADPFLVETADVFVLADTTTLRRQLLSRSTAMVVAATQTSSTLEVAAGRVARQLGTSASEAGTLCREAVTALDVHLGRPTDVSNRVDGVEQ